MTSYEERLERALAWWEHEQQAKAAQQEVQANYEAALARYPNADPDQLATAGEAFGWDFDAAADGLHQLAVQERDEWQAANPPADLGEAVDRFLNDNEA